MGVRKIHLSWDDVDALLTVVWNQVSEKGFKYVAGIPRGGLIPAILFSHKYGLEFLEYPSNHYNDLLIFDDIADTGGTLEKWVPNFPNPSFATLHTKTGATTKPRYTGITIPDDYGWIVYPWEKKDSKTIQDYLDN